MACFSSCKKGENSESTSESKKEEEVKLDGSLKIKVMDKGYGTKFLEEMVKAYKELLKLLFRLMENVLEWLCMVPERVLLLTT